MVYTGPVVALPANPENPGSVRVRGEYFPYGKSSDRRDERNRYRYIGVERDEATGLMITGPRMFMTDTGRFLQGDPIGSAKQSQYLYSGGRPTHYTDRSGYAAAPADTETSQEHFRSGETHVGTKPRAYTSGVEQGQGTVVTLELWDGSAGDATALYTYEQQQAELWAEVGGQALDGSTGSLERARGLGWGWNDLHDLKDQKEAEGHPNPDAFLDCGQGTAGSANASGYTLSSPDGQYPGRLVNKTANGTPTTLFGPGAVSDTNGAEPSLSMEQNQQLLNFLDDQLYEGNIVALGVNYHEGSVGVNTNNDGVTDHWMYIVGRTYDESGAVMYIGIDNASSDASLTVFYVDPETYALKKVGNYEHPRGATFSKPYTGTNARPLFRRE